MNAEKLLDGINRLAVRLPEVKIMEVCGTHTVNIAKYGIKQLLPENIKLISGPGCPVCVTAESDISSALSVAEKEGVIFTCFGDMLRVPCMGRSLCSMRAEGRDIRIVLSPMEALKTALLEVNRQVVYFGVGFETTAPLTAATIKAAASLGVKNLSVISAHKTMPQAIKALLSGKKSVDALLCPGHVAAITGAEDYAFVSEALGLPAAVSGFEPEDILASVLILLKLLVLGEKKCVNMYPRAVTKHGNNEAKRVMNDVFTPCRADWRGLGSIPESGLEIRDEYALYRACDRFKTGKTKPSESPGCICGAVLRGDAEPRQCRNFGTVCTPEDPAGPCMVSAEGACAAEYLFSRV